MTKLKGLVNVPAVHTFEEDKKFVDQNGNQSLATYVLVDYVDGVSLAQLVDKRDAKGMLKFHISEPFLRTIMKKLTMILLKLHRSGIAHCDIKPDNVIIDK